MLLLNVGQDVILKYIGQLLTHNTEPGLHSITENLLVIILQNPRFIREIIYTGCPRRNGQNFGRVFLILNYTDKTQNTYIRS